MIFGMNHLTLAVSNIDRSFTFYKDILGLRPLCKWDKGAYFLIGDFWFCLNLDDKRVVNPCYTHYAFSVSNQNFPLLRQKLIDSEVVIFKENVSPGDSLYFLDPDGHKLELHVGNWQSRIQAKKENADTWKNIEWYI